MTVLDKTATRTVVISYVVDIFIRMFAYASN